jgi:hypothetical protein
LISCYLKIKSNDASLEVLKTDVVIGRGGIAGLVSALELIEGGKKVWIVDRDKKENLGGLAKWAFGGMFFVDTAHQRRNGFEDSLDLAIQDWFGAAEFKENEIWGRKWDEKYIHLCTPHSYDWLQKHGIRFFHVVNWVERGLKRRGNSVPRFHMVWGTGWELIKVLKKKLLNHKNRDHLSFLFDCRVEELIIRKHVVKGVSGMNESSGVPFEAFGENVIIATGGVNGSIDRVKKNWFKSWGSPPEIILNGAHKYAIGDMHDAVQRHDGNVVNLDLQWNYAVGIRHYKPRKKDHGMSLVPPPTALWLNSKRERFGPEPLVSGFDTRHLVEAICQQEKKYSWQVLNYRIALKEFAVSGSEYNPLFRDKKMLKFVFQTFVTGNRKCLNHVIKNCEDVVFGHSVEELVAKMNALTGEADVQLEKVKKAIDQYDLQLNLGPQNASDLQVKQIGLIRSCRGTKTRTSNFYPINDKKGFPLLAFREFIVSRKSLRGIQTDLNCKVLLKPDAHGMQHVIEGLYSIGESAGFGGGGMHGKRSLEGTFLGACVITARVATTDILGRTLD